MAAETTPSDEIACARCDGRGGHGGVHGDWHDCPVCHGNGAVPAPQTTLPGGMHDADAGRAALLLVRGVISELRPDLGATVLTTALAEMAMTLPAGRRREYIRACEAMMLKCWLKAENANG